MPFLDPNVIDAVMEVDPEYKRIEGEAKPEKHALRALFDGEIPAPVLWRTKVGSSTLTPLRVDPPPPFHSTLFQASH